MNTVVDNSREKEYRYKAFISYRHVEPDKTIAKRLQKLLEKFSLYGTKTNWRIFRDESELPTSDDLSRDISDALNNSEYLIVICSKKLKESRWCIEEIESFKRLHNNTTANILTLLVDGFPEESFPRQICYSEVVVNNPETGEKEKSIIEVEPLAANIVGHSIAENIRKLKVEWLRIAAPLAGVSFDALYDRKHREKLMRNIAIAGALAGVLTVASVSFALYSNSMRQAIDNQYQLTQEENKRYLEQLELTNKANEQYKHQLDETQMKNEKAIGNQAQLYIDKGDTRNAIETLLTAYSEDNQYTPQLYDTDLLLSNTIGWFENKKYCGTKKFTHDYAVKEYAFFCEGKRMVSQDENSNVYIWDTDSGELIKKIGDYRKNSDSFRKLELYMPRTTELNGENELVKSRNDLFLHTDSNIAGAVIYLYERSNEKTEKYNKDNQFIFYKWENSLYKVDTLSGKAELVLEKEGYPYTSFFISDRYISGLSEEYIYIIDVTSGEIIRKISIQSERLREESKPNQCMGVSVLDDKAYVFDRDRGLIEFNISDENVCNSGTIITSDFPGGSWFRTKRLKIIDNKVICVYPTEGTFGYIMEMYDIRTGEKHKFDTQKGRSIENTEIIDVGIIYAAESELPFDCLYFIVGNEIQFYDMRNYKLVLKKTTQSDIVNYYVNNSGIIYAYLYNGNVRAIVPKRYINEGYECQFDLSQEVPVQNVFVGAYYAGRTAVSDYGGKDIVIYEKVDDKDVKAIIGEQKGYHPLDKIYVNEDRTWACFIRYRSEDDTDHLWSLNLLTNETREIAEVDSSGNKNGFIDKNTFFLDGIGRDKKKYFNVESTQLVASPYVDNTELLCPYTMEKVCLIKRYGEKPQIKIELNGKQEIWCIPEDLEHRNLNATKFCFSDTGKYLLINTGDASYFDNDDSVGVVLSRETGQFTRLNIESSILDDVNNYEWNEKKAVLYIYTKSGVVGIVDLTNGKMIKKVQIPNTAIVKLYEDDNCKLAIDDNATVYRFDDNFVVLDSIEINQGVSKVIAGNLDKMVTVESMSENEIIVHTSADGALATFSHCAWVIDMNRFKIKYTIPNYGTYLERNNSVITYSYNGIYEVPLYSSKQLYDKAYSYIY